MKARLLSVIKYILILSIGVGMLWLAFSGVSLKDTIQHMMNAKMTWLLLSVAASLVAFYSRAVRWNLLIEPLGYKPSNLNTSASLMVGYLANLAVPRLGEVSRCGALSKVESVPFNSALGTVIIERLIDVVCLLICIMLVAFNEYERLGNFLYENIYTPVTSKFSIITNNPLVVLTIAIVLIGIIYLVFRRHEKGGEKVAKFSALIKGVIDGIDTIRKMKRPVAFVAHTILIWVMYFLMSYICFRALEPTASLDWHAGLFVLVVGGMGMSAPVQGGIGAYHLLVSQGLILYGISKENGLTFAILMHGSQTLVVIILGGLSYLYLFLKRKMQAQSLTQTPPTLDLIRNKVFDLAQMKHRVAMWKLLSRKIVFTNGCFDLLHLGHIDYLAKAADEGDDLIIGLNSDVSTRGLKGPNRPINNQEQRAMILAALGFVSAVVCFDEPTPYELIKAIEPHVLVKGSDYKVEEIVGHDIVLAKNGLVKTIDILPGYSTTLIEEKIRKSSIK